MWSGSKDDQTSQDAQIAGQATGAMSWAFIAALRKNPQQSYVQLLNSIRDELADKYTQKPQLSCSHPLGKAYPVNILNTIWTPWLTILQTRTFSMWCRSSSIIKMWWPWIPHFCFLVLRFALYLISYPVSVDHLLWISRFPRIVIYPSDLFLFSKWDMKLYDGVMTPTVPNLLVV